MADEDNQHKFAKKLDEKKALAAQGDEKAQKYLESSAAKVLVDYLEGVPDSRGGTLGRVTDNDSSFSSGDAEGDKYRKEFYEGAGGKGSNYLKGINTVLARQGLSGDDYFNYRQQLYSQDPEAYKKAFPGSSGQLLQKLVQVATPGLNWINAIKNGITNTSQAKNFTNEDVVESTQLDDNQEDMIDTSIVDIKQTNENKINAINAEKANLDVIKANENITVPNLDNTNYMTLSAENTSLPSNEDVMAVQEYVKNVKMGVPNYSVPNNLGTTWQYMLDRGIVEPADYFSGQEIVNQVPILHSNAPIIDNNAVAPANMNFNNMNFNAPLNYDLMNEKKELLPYNVNYPGVL
jgi:hypothetical protein